MQKDTMGHKALPQDRQFYLPGPFGPLPVIITYGATEEARRRVFVMAHGFRGSMDGGGRAVDMARDLSPLCTVVRFAFSWCTLLTNQIAEFKAVAAYVRRTLAPQKLYCLGAQPGRRHGHPAGLFGPGLRARRPDPVVRAERPGAYLRPSADAACL